MDKYRNFLPVCFTAFMAVCRSRSVLPWFVGAATMLTAAGANESWRHG